MKEKTGPGRLRIVSLTAENIKRIRAVHIVPNDSLVQVTGANGSGKSSVLDSIWWALQGKGVVQSQPIRKGQRTGMIRIDFGSLVVTRNFIREEDGEYTTSLSVENDEGAIYSSPQKMLDGFLGSLSFDPLAFMEKDGKGKVDQLRRIVNIDLDFDEVDRLNRRDFDRRTEVNRQVRSLTERVATFKSALADGDDSPVPVAPILDQMEAVAAANAAIEKEKTRRENAAEEADRVTQRASALVGEAIGLRRRADELDAEAGRMNERAVSILAELKSLDPVPSPRDVGALRAELHKANEENDRRQTSRSARANHAAAVADLKTMTDQADVLTSSIEERTRSKSSALAAAKMPVDGLEFGDGDVLWRGIPLDQASTAEQIRVSLAVGMAMNPDLRVILIRQGSLLDETSVEIVRTWAEENDFQVWMERVDSSGKVGIVMEDGEARVAP